MEQLSLLTILPEENLPSDEKELIREEKRKLYKKRYYKEHKDEIKIKNKNRYEKNKEKILKQYKEYISNPEIKERKSKTSAEYRKKNKDILNKKKKIYFESPAKYDSYITKLEKYHECQRDPKNPDLLQVKCKYCGNWLNPTNRQVIERLKCINNKHGDGRSHGDGEFYCSKGCRRACPIFRQRSRPRGFQVSTSRETSPELRKMVLERDNWTCQKCGGSKKDNIEIELHCHHIDPVINNPIESADIDNCITLCVDCHGWVHRNIPGCSYVELRSCKN